MLCSFRILSLALCTVFGTFFVFLVSLLLCYLSQSMFFCPGGYGEVSVQYSGIWVSNVTRAIQTAQPLGFG